MCQNENENTKDKPQNKKNMTIYITVSKDGDSFMHVSSLQI